MKFQRASSQRRAITVCLRGNWRGRAWPPTPECSSILYVFFLFFWQAISHDDKSIYQITWNRQHSQQRGGIRQEFQIRHLSSEFLHLLKVPEQSCLHYKDKASLAKLLGQQSPRWPSSSFLTHLAVLKCTPKQDVAVLRCKERTVGDAFTLGWSRMEMLDEDASKLCPSLQQDLSLLWILRGKPKQFCGTSEFKCLPWQGGREKVAMANSEVKANM